MSDLVKKSKHLSKVLRHEPESLKLVLDKAGWCDVSSLLDAMRMTQEELDIVVETNSKKRFEFNFDKSKIRASQGHSVDVNLEYKPEVPPEYLLHGTSLETVSVLLSVGISKMGRHAVHLSADKDVALMVARRKGTPAIVRVHAKVMHADGFQFYISTNGVWLVDNVPAKYIDILN